MYLLANYGAGNKMSWNDVAKFMRKRTSTQVRTHVQKFRNKNINSIKELDSIIALRFPDEEKEEVYDTDFKLEPRHNILIRELSKEYLKIIQSSKEMDDAGMNYTAILIENKLIPNFISKIYAEVGAEEKMESSIKRMLSMSSSAAELFRELKH